ncbi:MAG: dihydrodipicolinate synthase family protein [Pseudomonadota bacterium]
MQGLFAAVPTPVDEDFIPQQDMLVEHGWWALENGCDGLVLLGSTGEAYPLGTAMRKAIMGAIAQQLPVKQMMVSTSIISADDAAMLSLYADQLGFPAVLLLPPTVYKNISEQGIFEWYERVNSLIDHTDLEVYFYNYPQLIGFEIPVVVMRGLMEKYPKRFCGVKDSSGSPDYLEKLVNNLEGAKIFPSSEVFLASKASSNVYAGCISATLNVTAPLFAKLWKNREKIDSALMSEIKEFRDAVSGDNLIPMIKHILAHRYEDLDWENVVLPHLKLGEEDKKRLSPYVQKYGQTHIIDPVEFKTPEQLQQSVLAANPQQHPAQQHPQQNVMPQQQQYPQQHPVEQQQPAQLQQPQHPAPQQHPQQPPQYPAPQQYQSVQHPQQMQAPQYPTQMQQQQQQQQYQQQPAPANAGQGQNPTDSN